MPKNSPSVDVERDAAAARAARGTRMRGERVGRPLLERVHAVLGDAERLLEVADLDHQRALRRAVRAGGRRRQRRWWGCAWVAFSRPGRSAATASGLMFGSQCKRSRRPATGQSDRRRLVSGARRGACHGRRRGTALRRRHAGLLRRRAVHLLDHLDARPRRTCSPPSTRTPRSRRRSPSSLAWLATRSASTPRWCGCRRCSPAWRRSRSSTWSARARSGARPAASPRRSPRSARS